MPVGLFFWLAMLAGLVRGETYIIVGVGYNPALKREIGNWLARMPADRCPLFRGFQGFWGTCAS